jgi:hypothetical protein
MTRVINSSLRYGTASNPIARAVLCQLIVLPRDVAIESNSLSAASESRPDLLTSPARMLHSDCRVPGGDIPCRLFHEIADGSRKTADALVFLEGHYLQPAPSSTETSAWAVAEIVRL